MENVALKSQSLSWIHSDSDREIAALLKRADEAIRRSTKLKMECEERRARFKQGTSVEIDR